MHVIFIISLNLKKVGQSGPRNITSNRYGPISARNQLTQSQILKHLIAVCWRTANPVSCRDQTEDHSELFINPHHRQQVSSAYM